MGITHPYTSTVADGGNTSLVQPSDWNATHTIANGTAGLPGLAPTSDATKGFYFSETAEVGVSVSGVEVFDFGATRNKSYQPIVIEDDGQTSIAYTNMFLSGCGLSNNYYQMALQNKSTGTAASMDYVVTCTGGTDGSGYLDLGVNGSGFSSPTWTINTANDGYLYMNSYNLALGTDTAGKNVVIFTGGLLAANAKATFSDALTTFAGTATFSGAATFTVPVVYTATASSTTDGALWNDSTRGAPGWYENNTKMMLPGILWTKTAATALATYTTATAAIGTAGTGVGTLTIGTGALTLGKSILVKMAGVMGSSAVSTGHTLALTIGGTSVCTTGAAAIPASLTNRGWWAEFVLTCRATGAAGFVFGSGFIQVHTAAAGTAHVLFSTNTTTTAAANTSTALDIGVTSAWASAHANNTFTCHNCVVYILN